MDKDTSKHLIDAGPGLWSVPNSAAQPAEPLAWCSLNASGRIEYFDGKPMVMVGPVGNEHHTTLLYPPPAPAAAQPAEPVAVMWLYPDGRRYTMTWVGQDEDRMQEMIAERGLIRQELYAAPTPQQE